MAEDALGQVADELYALPASEFTAARNARAKAAKADGDKALAARISALPRPSTAAWLVNQLVRADLPAIDALLELGERMRTAQSQLDADQIRALTPERRKAVAALTRQARELGAARKQSVSAAVADEIEGTFTAALADPAAATAVRSARLTKALAYAGFGEVELDGAVAVPRRLALVPDAPSDAAPDQQTEKPRKAAKAPKPQKPQKAEKSKAQQVEEARRAREVERAEAALKTARERLKDSEAALADLQAQLERARTRAAAARDAVERAEARVADADPPG